MQLQVSHASRRSTIAAIALAVLLAVPGFARAQGSYPNKPVRLIVAYAAGGVADVIGKNAPLMH